jgi:hypothetical protein
MITLRLNLGNPPRVAVVFQALVRFSELEET